MFSNDTILERVGYGSSFNTIYIYNNMIKKESKNIYGNEKIKKEMNFYKYITVHTSFPVPTIYEYGINYYIMEYLKDYKPLYLYFPFFSITNKHNMLQQIYHYLSNLHSQTSKTITKEILHKSLVIETYDKIIARYKEIEHILLYFIHITHVNGVKLLSFNEIMTKIQIKVSNYLESLTEYKVCILHGDCQFNNIIYNPNIKTIIFIDPRGYFGNQELYGIAEYDYAKIKFALSGYDIFDNMHITSLNIEENNLIIDDIFQMNDIFSDDIISTLTLSIWLGNAHCFKNNIPKAMYSYFYAIYLSTLYL